MPRHKHPEKNIKIVKNVYKMKLRHSAVACTFCGHLHSSADEIKRLNSITYEKNVRFLPKLVCKIVLVPVLALRMM